MVPKVPLDGNHEPEGAPPPVAWREYAVRVAADWRVVLENEPTNEKAFQRFLEQHPSLLPLTVHHAAWPDMIVRQPAMKGFMGRKPDFMGVEQNSARLRAVLYEIETPAKRWATEGGKQHADLTAAIDQTEDWRVWFSETGDVPGFRRHYGLTMRDGFEQRYVVIHGSRKEANQHELFARKRRTLAKPDVELMTYDRLEPHADLANFVTVTRIQEHRRDEPKFELAGLPATFTFDLLSPRLCAVVRMNESVVRQTPYMTRERGQLIIDQWKVEAERGLEQRPLLLRASPD